MPFSWNIGSGNRTRPKKYKSPINYSTPQTYEKALENKLQRVNEERENDRVYYGGMLSGPTIFANQTPEGYRSDKQSRAEDLASINPKDWSKVPRQYHKDLLSNRIRLGKFSNPETETLNNIALGVAHLPEWVAPLPFGGMVSDGAKYVGKQIGRVATKSKNIIKQTYNINPWAEKLVDPNASFRVAGEDAFKDFLKSGVVRSSPEGKLHSLKFTTDDGVEHFIRRPTGFPSFQKGYADFRYADPNMKNYVYETYVPTFKRKEVNPVTGNIIGGRHYAHRPIDMKTGEVITELPAKDVEVFEAVPHWLKGYKKVKLPTTKTVESTAKSLPEEKFVSEIDWGKWNKDTPKHKILMDEYATIEKEAKRKGVWLKHNFDGSEFIPPKYDPEIEKIFGADEKTQIMGSYVQRQSSFLKKYLGDNVITKDLGHTPVMYTGSPNKNIIKFKQPGETGYVKNPTTTTGESGVYFSNDYNYATKYQNFQNTKDLNGRTYATYLSPKTGIKVGDHASAGINSDLGPSFLWHHNKIPVDAVLSGKYMRQLYPKHGYEVSIENSNLIKSALSNVGFFDISNPNIYKSLLPLGVIGTTLPKLNKRNENQQLLKYQKGKPIARPFLGLYSHEALNNNITPTFYQKRSLPRHPLAPQYRQVSEAAENLYFDSLDFLEKEYGPKIKPTHEDVREFAKDVYGTTQLEYYNKFKDSYENVDFSSEEDVKKLTEYARQQALRNLSSYYDYTKSTLVEPDSVKFKKWFDVNNPMQKLKQLPKKFNYTVNPTPSNILGFYDTRTDEFSVNVDEDEVKNKRFTTPIHELTHRLDGLISYHAREHTPLVNVELLNKLGTDLDQRSFDYLSDPFEIRARKNALLYWLKSNGKPYKNISPKTLDSLYTIKNSLPPDVSQLLTLYTHQPTDLLEFLNNPSRYNTEE